MTGNLQKFLFDQNNFDDNAHEEDEAPPPPVFNEQELTAAKETSYAQGKQDGLAQAEASQEKKIADLIAGILRQANELLSFEEQRAAAFERDTLLLTQAVFSRAFPLLAQSEGLNEIMNVISQALENCREKPEINIEVPSDFSEAVSLRIERILAEKHITGALKTIPSNQLMPGACRVIWKDGGVRRDPAQVAGQIETILKEMLADKARLRDNETTGAKS